MRHAMSSRFVLFAINVLAVGISATAGVENAGLTVGDSRVKVTLDTRDGRLCESGFTVDGQTLPALAGTPVFLQIDGRRVQPAFSHTAEGDASGPPSSAKLVAEDDFARWELVYQVTGLGRITKSLSGVAKKPFRLERIGMWDSVSGGPAVVARTSIQDIAAFFRCGQQGLFASLDFPYSQIDAEQNKTAISYPPFLAVNAEDRLTCCSLTFGAVTLAGRSRYGFDDGEVEAMDSYIQQRYTPRFERPMVTSASIVNLYTQVRGDVVFYTMKDHPTLRDNIALLERELALLPKLGIEYYQVFPGIFDWGPNDPDEKEVDRLMAVARSHHVRMGDYSGSSSVFCAHYNEYRNGLNKPEWLIRAPDGQVGGGFCFGNANFVDWYAQRVTMTCKRFGFEVHILDFLDIRPCHATDHGHPAGRDSLYHQVAGLDRLLKAINATSPEMMTWSNSGNWGELLPKIAWSNPNLYLTDPFIATPWQGLNMTRLLDDARREQMVSLHYSRFIPYRFLTNCQYFFSQNSIVPDIRNFEYGALSTLAVTPNLCLAEIRPWLDRMPEADRERVAAFYRRWIGLVRDNFRLWTTTYSAGENPGMGAVEIYAHADGDRGFIFVVNPQYWDRTVRIPLDKTLGFRGAGRCEVAELYPIERLRLTPDGPTAALGSALTMTVPAQQVLVLQVRPAPERIESPRLYELPGTIESNGDVQVVKTHGPQGRSERFAVVLPAGAKPIRSAEVRADVPRQPLRSKAETGLQLLSSEGPVATLEVTFRRTPAPTALRDWTVRPGDLAQGTKAEWIKGWACGDPLRFPLFVGAKDAGVTLPMTDGRAGELALGPLANFCGGYVENAFQENQETWITLRSDGPLTTQPAAATRAEAPPEPHPMPREARDPQTGWWLQTRFHLPFMYTMGAEPAFDQHTLLVLPMVRQAACKSVQAWVNGVPLEVRAYRYPRNRGLACYYADLVGSGAQGGENLLVVQIQY